MLGRYRIVAIGSSDTHRPPTSEFKDGSPVGTPTNFVGAKALTQKDILHAIKHGRVWIGENPSSYALRFTGETGKARVDIGEVLNVQPNGEVKLRFSGNGFPVGAVARLISGGAAVKTLTLEKGDFVEELVAQPTDNEYFRLEVRDASEKMLAFTNPIYIRTKP